MVSCPFCKTENESTGKEWDYGAFHVKDFVCKKCMKRYRAYYKNGAFNHTVPKPKE